MRMLVSTPPVSHLDPVRPARVALSVLCGSSGGVQMIPSAYSLASSVGLVEVRVGSCSQRAPLTGGSLSIGEFSQPAPQGLSLVASFRSLQNRPRNGSSRSAGAMVPCPGPSGGTVWRL